LGFSVIFALRIAIYFRLSHLYWSIDTFFKFKSLKYPLKLVCDCFGVVLGVLFVFEVGFWGFEWCFDFWE
jgi:hypothetical protein